MAEPLKQSFGIEVASDLGDMLVAAYPGFDRAGFTAACAAGYDDLELTGRARHIAAALASFLPADRERALRIVTRSLGPEIEEAELAGMEVFRYLPLVYFVAEHGLDHFEAAMTAQYELTKRFTAEFSIRAFIDRYPDATLDRLRLWAGDTNVHVRRLVSEGTRPRLPWAPRLRRFQDDPAPVVALLELLKDDPEEYVRRSVANNLNDIAKDHPDLVVEIAERWWGSGGPERRRLVRHALRTLVKRGDPGALAVLGYGLATPIRVTAVRIEPPVAAIGESVRIEVDLHNPAPEAHGALVDLIVHFVKVGGATSAKVFKGAELELAGGGRGTIRKTVSLRQQTTRTHYPGRHAVDVQLNGAISPGGEFTVTA